MFGHAVTVYFKDTFAKYGDKFKELGINPNNGLGDVYDKIQVSKKKRPGCISAIGDGIAQRH